MFPGSPDKQIWDKLAGTLTEKWQVSVSVPAFFFWIGVFLIWFLTHDCDFLPTLAIQSDIIRGVLLFAIFYFLVLVSSSLMEWATFLILRLFEGYWNLDWVYLPFVGRFLDKSRKTEQTKKDLNRKMERLQELDNKYQEEGLNFKEQKNHVKLIRELNNYPKDNEYLLPTDLGNIICAAEEYPYLRYGLEFNTVFPRLFLVLPEPFQTKVTKARQVLNGRVRLVVWGALFLPCSILPFIRCYSDWHDFVTSIWVSIITLVVFIIVVWIGVKVCVAIKLVSVYLKLCLRPSDSLLNKALRSDRGKKRWHRFKEKFRVRLRIKSKFWGVFLYLCIVFYFFRRTNWYNQHTLIVAITVSFATLLISTIVIILALKVSTSAASSYASVLRSAFDLHRFKLYDELKWEKPISPKTEQAHGLQLTQFLAYHHASPGSKFKMSDTQQPTQIDLGQFELKNFSYLIEAGNKAFEMPIDLAIKNLAYGRIYNVIMQVKQSLEKLADEEEFFEIIRQYPRALEKENLDNVFNHFVKREEELMSDAGLHSDWESFLCEKLTALVDKLSQLLDISHDIFPFLSWTDLQDLSSRQRKIKYIKGNLSKLYSDLEELENKLKNGLVEPQKIQETLNISCLFLGGATLVFINCSAMVSKGGFNSEFSELSILLGSILLVEAFNTNY